MILSANLKAYRSLVDKLHEHWAEDENWDFSPEGEELVDNLEATWWELSPEEWDEARRYMYANRASHTGKEVQQPTTERQVPV